MKSFSRVVQTSKPPDAVRTEALTSLTEPLARYGYVLMTESESGLTFARQYRPWWVWVLAVVIFPVGLLFLFAPNTATVTMVLEPEKNGALVRVFGHRRTEGRAGFRVHGVVATGSPLVAVDKGTGVVPS